jgi:acyl-CoA reductase-like NAD-dependent aldehyde dehydrogenase
VFLRAAELLTTTWRATINAATMLGQSKTVFQAEIDAASETIDFLRFNPYFAQQIHDEQPLSSHAIWNAVEYRPLEGFVYAVTPFNFTSIAANLPTAPALMGNTVVWKPASSAMLSAYYVMRLLEAAGLPPGVINFVPGDAAQVSGVLLDSPDLAGVHFTGSTSVFQQLPHVSAAGRGDRRQGLHRGAPVSRPAGAGRGHRAGRVRVSGAEVLGRQPRVRADVAVAGRARQSRGDDAGHAHG